jgi:hypothetical protein
VRQVGFDQSTKNLSAPMQLFLKAATLDQGVFQSDDVVRKA